MTFLPHPRHLANCGTAMTKFCCRSVPSSTNQPRRKPIPFALHRAVRVSRACGPCAWRLCGNCDSRVASDVMRPDADCGELRIIGDGALGHPGGVAAT